MGFTGILGTEDAQLGYFVLGISDSFGLIPIQCNIYPNSSKSIIITFENPVTDSALVASRYSVQPVSEISGQFWKLESGKAFQSTVEFVVGQQLTVTSGANNTSVLTISSAKDGVYTFLEPILPDSSTVTFITGVPFATGVKFLDPNKRSVEVTFGADLPPDDYEVTISNVGDFQGRVVESTPRPFTISSARSTFATHAKFSSEETIDLVFDKPVNPYTTAGAFELLNEAGDSAVLTVEPWAGADIPPNTIRLSTSSVPGTFAFKSLSVGYTNVLDVSTNANDGVCPLTFENRVGATQFSQITPVHITEAFLLDRWDEHKICVVRVYFNSQLDSDSVLNTDNWVISTSCGHSRPDSSNTLSVVAASDLTSLTALVKHLEIKIIGHLNDNNFHYSSSSKKSVPDNSYSGLEQTISHLKSLVLNFNSHVVNADRHQLSDDEAKLDQIEITNLADAITLANSLRSSYETHRSNTRQITFTSLPIGGKFPINNHASPDTFIQNSFGPSYFVDLYINGVHPTQPIQVQCEIDSHSGSTTTDPDSTGKIKLKSPEPGFFQVNKSRVEFWNKDQVRPEIRDFSNNGLPLWMSFERQFTNDMFVYAINKLFGFYNVHISTQGAGHLGSDSNTVPDSYFPDSWNPIGLEDLIWDFYDNYMGPHIGSSVYHTNTIGQPRPNSIFEMFNELRSHNLAGSDSKMSLFGQHTSSGKDGGALPGPNMLSAIIQQPLSNSTITANGVSTFSFSYPSSGQSVIQTPGVLNNLNGKRMKTEETLQINFSEPLMQTDLNVSDFTISSSGNVQVLDATWSGDRTIILKVRGLLSDTSTVYCNNLKSRSGESI